MVAGGQDAPLTLWVLAASNVHIFVSPIVAQSGQDRRV